jgi:hypothetical protein
MGVKLGNGKWAIKEDKLLAYNDNSGRFFNKEFDFSRGSSATYVAKDGLIKTAGLQATNLVNNGDFSELGSEIITNGNFDTDSNWTKGTGWSISDGKATYDGSGLGYQFILQAITTTLGSTYKITFDVLSSTGSNLNIVDFGSVRVNQSHLTEGNYTFYAQADSSSENIIIYANGTDTFSIDNVSVKQVDPNDYWSLGTGWSFGDGKAVATNAADAERLRQDDVFTAGKTYKVTYEITEISQGGFRGYVGGTNLTIRSAVGVYTETLVAPAIDVFYIRTVGTTSGSIDNISVQEIQTDTPRIDFSDSVKGALLLEPQSTNLITYSQDFSHPVWRKRTSDSTQAPVITSNYAISPDGTQNATRVVITPPSSDVDYAVVDNYGSITKNVGDKFTCSIYVKANGSSQIGKKINLYQFEDGYSTVLTHSLTDNWVRLELTNTMGLVTSNMETLTIGKARSFVGGSSLSDMATDFLIAFAQFEQQSYATSYIVSNSGSTTTRLADVCNNSGSAQDFSEEGVLYAEIAALANDGTFREISLNDGTTNNAVEIRYTNTDNLFQFVVRDGGTVSVASVFTLTNVLEFNKIALSYKTDDYKMYINGIEVATDTSGTTPSGLNRLSFNWGGSNPFYGKVRELQVFTEALTDEELEKLTQV